MPVTLTGMNRRNWMRYEGFRTLVTLGLILFTAGLPGFTQTPGETEARVPALDSFHEVIYKIWHEAWPKSDVALLKKLSPEVEKGIETVAAAPLPGILRDKKTVWEEGVKNLQRAGDEYKAAAAVKDDKRLMTAAEALHSRFEGLMRAIRPAMSELDDFHTTLYMLYHYYLPEYEIEKIKSSATELKQKMAALNAAKLPERLKQKETEFEAARSRLSKSVNALEDALRTNQEKTVKAAIETLHSNYQALDRVFK
jgi:hypothetical protein